ncbi:MAG: DUF805 domain-containing protein [Lentisphaeraceae bacterium]|nr:DUF805 domain-containing protein [Lentisphaeraceae bacterium]
MTQPTFGRIKKMGEDSVVDNNSDTAVLEVEEKVVSAAPAEKSVEVEALVREVAVQEIPAPVIAKKTPEQRPKLRLKGKDYGDEDVKEEVLENGKPCPSCKKTLAENAKLCVDCGFDLKKGKKTKIAKAKNKKGPVNPYGGATKKGAVTNAAKNSEYGGIGRLAYFGANIAATGISVGATFFLTKANAEGPAETGIGAMSILAFTPYVVITLWAINGRIKNTGYSGWTWLWLFIPVVNLLPSFRLAFAPEGYADHKKLDFAGKAMICLLLAIPILGILAAIFLPALGKARAAAKEAERKANLEGRHMNSPYVQECVIY